ncbi:MAG TPA: carboxypeptidase regulatory-like domain-containing protein, partial [Polyangiaceae bacterium]
VDVDAGWDTTDTAGDELTRQLPEHVVPSRTANTFSDIALTSPLPPTAAAPLPYGSDAELTRPLRPETDAPSVSSASGPFAALGRRPVPSIPPLCGVPTLAPPPPPAPGQSSQVPVVVAAPPRSVGAMEHPPSVQIATNASRRSAPPPPPTAYGRDDTHETMPRIPRSAPVPTEFGVRRSGSSMSPVTGSVPPPPLGQPSRRMIALAAIAFGVGALALVFRPRTGSLIVTAADADGAPVRGISIRVDGVERCTASPCRLSGLPTGAHLIRAAGAGFPASAERAVSVESGEPAAEHVTLTGARHPERSGLGVSAVGDGLHVLVDGRDLGAPPVSLRDVEPGAHTVRVVGAAGLYEPYEETVKLDSGEVRSLGPIRLHVLKGRLKLSAGDGAEGATIAVDGHRVAQLPTTLELSPEESHEITATRRGFADLSEQVVFDGTAERSLTVSLEPSSGGRQGYAPASPVANSQIRKAASVAAPAQATDSATLDINSSPRTNVVLNGRPLGSTPLAGVRVSAGRQTIVFIHPQLGRKIASTNVPAGKHGSAFVKF